MAASQFPEGAALPSGLVQAKGDLLVGDAPGVLGRMPSGTDGQVLRSTTTGPAWGAERADVPLSTVQAAGDLIVGTGAATVGRLAAGANGQVLTYDSFNGPMWVTSSGGPITVIAETVLTAAAAGINFASLPNTYRSLLITVSGRFDGTAVATDLHLRFNGDSTNVYAFQYDYVAASTSSPNAVNPTSYILAGVFPGGGAVAGAAGSAQILIPNFNSTAHQKTVLTESYRRVGTAAADQGRLAGAGTYFATAVPTSVMLFTSGGQNLVAGTTATLYGIKGA